MPVRCHHYSANSNNVGVGDAFVEQVAHRVDEDDPWCSPFQWLCQFLRNYSQIESLFERMPRYSTKSFCEGLRIAVSTAGTDLGTATNRVPGCVGPFNLAICTHRVRVRLSTSRFLFYFRFSFANSE